MTLAELKAAALGGGPANPFAVAYLQLCQVSYLPEASIVSGLAQLPPLNEGGSWRCAWGPAQSPDEANLVFVAVYEYAAGMPVFASVVVRGTDLSVGDPLGILEQVWEDIDVASQVPLPWDPSSPARLAKGTLDALDVIQGLRSGGQSLAGFLGPFLADPANGNPVLVVTGHSLGGCLVSVVAPWLKSALGAEGTAANIVPVSYAGPTAGNEAFAECFDAAFPYGMRFHNSLDVVPHGWWNLTAVETIYDPCGLPIPDIAYLAILGWEAVMNRAGVSYVQPRTNNCPLTGSCLSPRPSSWFDELAHQHHTTTYMSLLGGNSIEGQAARKPSTGAPARPLHTSLWSRVDAAIKARLP